MSEPVRVYVNERPVEVEPGATVRAAVAAADAALAAALDQGRAYATDGRGIRIGPERTLSTGAIVRVVLAARRPDADARA
ncbi:MAG TPA: hypothetical protein VFK09_07930 [Gemmatimonadales bacterium]|nr:hypothetical protein [Gemmatimonadales bacterium]